MKTKNIIAITIIVLSMMLTACSSNTADKSETTDGAKLLTEVKTTQFFTEEPVPQEDIDKILSAGVNAPSAMNTQPWHFTAVTDKEITANLADAMKNMKLPAMKDGAPMMPSPRAPDMMMPSSGAPENPPKPIMGKGNFSKAPSKAGIGDAPLTIVISCQKGSELSAGLAVQNMSAEAQLLGYGTKIMTAPAMSLNGEEYKSMLCIPEGQDVVAVLIVGKPESQKDNPDAVSGATTRNAFEDVVTIIGQ